MKIKGLVALQTSYEERFAEEGVRCLFFHEQMITEFTASIVAVVYDVNGEFIFLNALTLNTAP